MLNPIIWLLYQLINIYFWIIIAQVVMSWLISFGIVNISNPTVRQIGYALNQMTEPALRPLRRIIPSFGGLDITPIFLLLGLQFLQYLLVYINMHWL